jgi:hypothetical protein
MKDRAAQKSSLKYLADKLLSGKSFGTSSNEFFSACAVNQQGDVYGGNVFQRADISSANKILLATTGPKFMRAPGAELARKIFQDVKETAKLALADIDIDFISSALGVSKPAFTIADFGSYSLEEISAVAKYMRFDNVPRATLVKLRHDLKSSGIFADTSGIDNAIIIQDGYDMLAAKSDGLGVDEFLMRATASREKTAIDAAYVVFGEALRKRTERPESFSTYEIDVAANLVKAGKPNDLFDEIYADSPFDFLADFDKVAEADRAYALRFLRAIVLSKAVTARQGFMIAIKAGLDSEFSVLAKEAFDEQLNDIALIRQSDLREHPDYKEGSVDAALLVLSFLTESPDFKRDVDKLRATIAALGLVPSRGLGVTASVLNGSFGVERKDGYAELAQVFVPDVLRAIKATGCDGHAYQSLIESDQLKDVVWGAILD